MTIIFIYGHDYDNKRLKHDAFMTKCV